MKLSIFRQEFQTASQGGFFQLLLFLNGEKESIINFSSRILMATEQKVHNLGLDFTSIPKYNSFQARIDIFRLIRVLKLRKMFGTGDTDSVSTFDPMSTFTPSIWDPVTCNRHNYVAIKTYFNRSS